MVFGDVFSSYIVWFFQVLILVGLGFTVQRSRILKDLLWGVPGIVV